MKAACQNQVNKDLVTVLPAGIIVFVLFNEPGVLKGVFFFL